MAVSEATEDTRVGLIGKTVGRYRVTGELGRGGMATVYRAHDPQLGRDVAIKVMHGAFAGRSDLEARFRREARAVAAIKHDGIVDVYDFAPAAAGEPGYIVTEIVEGPTLRALCDQHGGRLLPEVTALIAARIAGALGAAHARGIVHRDVKPDNVMFDLAGAGPVRALLTDFGIAHMTEAETMTATGAIVGSPIYMSPEQARGQDILPASDVFSLGVMLYHVTTGRRAATRHVLGCWDRRAASTSDLSSASIVTASSKSSRRSGRWVVRTAIVQYPRRRRIAPGKSTAFPSVG